MGSNPSTKTDSRLQQVEIELARQKKEGECLQEKMAHLAQVAAKDRELLHLYFAAVAQFLSASFF